MTKQKKDKKEEKPRVNTKLDGFEVKIDTFGEIRSNLNIDNINAFLNKEVEDKKLVDRADYEELKKNTEDE